ncbi:MAG: tetratricopeptide repeat protein [Thermodesulfobacteriota bacterium]
MFKDYTVLLIAKDLELPGYRELLEPLGFGRIEILNHDAGALAFILEIKPNLIAVDRDLPSTRGADLLASVRREWETSETPFILFGSAEDYGPGGLAEEVQKNHLALFLGLPMNQKEVGEKIVEFLDPLLDPDREKAYGLLDEAARLIINGEKTTAALRYAEALELFDGHAEAWMDYAGLLADLGRSDEAENAFLQSLKLDQYNLDGYGRLAGFYEAQQLLQPALSLFQQALGIAIIKHSPTRVKAGIIVNIGRLDLKLKRLAEAEVSFDRAVETNPHDAGTRADIGDAYTDRGYFAEAEKYYRAALDLDPDLAHVFNKLGIAYRRQKKYDKALELYASARANHPRDEHLLFNMARAHFDAGQLDKAEILLNEALSLAPTFKAARSLLAKVKPAG